jgi:hypothetical protein
VTFRTLPAALLAAIGIAWTTSAAFGATPAPPTTAHPKPPTVHLPTVPLHTEVVVEVNKKGQVVRVKSTKPCKVASFNVQTFGNALQMWIRRRDGTAQVGLYRVIYDYNPKTQHVTRHVALVSLGGNWGNAEGAANVMLELAKKEALQAQKQARQAQKNAQERNAKLPSLNQIRGVSPSPNASKPPTLPPV